MKANSVKFTDGTHIVAMYTVEENVLNAILPFFAEGLKKKERCFYAASPDTISKVKNGLINQEIDVEECFQKEQLVLLNNKDPLLKDGKFDAKYLVELYREDIDQALNQGWKHVRATAEMSWLIEDVNGADEILYYEALSTELFNNTKHVHAICQYNIARITARQTIELLKIHPWALVDNIVNKNPYWIDPHIEDYRP